MNNKIQVIVKNLFSKDSLSKKTAKNMLLSGICRPISIVLSYIYVPIVLNYLDVEKYGVWSTILSILSWIGFADLGIGNGLRNKLTESITRHEDERSRKLVSSSYAIVAIIMTFVAIVLSFIFGFLDWGEIFGVTDENGEFKKIVIMSVCFVAINFVLSLCTNVLYALQEAAVVSYLSLATQIINLVGILFLSTFSKGNLFFVSILYGFSMIVVNFIANFVIYLGKHKKLAPSIYYVDKRIGIDLTSLGFQFFVIQICALVLFTTDSFIISNLFGASEVTPYSIVNKLFTAISNLYAALLTPIWSSVTMAKTEKNYSWLKRLIKKLKFIMIPFIFCAILTGIVFRPLCHIWLQKDLSFNSSLIWLGVVYCILSMWCNTYAYIGNGMEIMKEQIIIAVSQAVVNIPLSVLFAKNLNMGISGVLLGTIVSMEIAAFSSPIIINNSIKKLKETI